MIIYSIICILFILVVVKLVLLLINNNDDKGNNNVYKKLEPLPFDSGLESTSQEKNKKELIDFN